MNVSNPGLAFNKTVFKELSADYRSRYRNKTKELHQALFAEALGDKWKPLAMDDAGTATRPFKSIELQIAWPGMMMGLGYGHAAKTTIPSESNLKLHPHETEVKTGFYFDFTTGLPVLPGSTVKGILRSFFPGRIRGSSTLKKAVTDRLIRILNVDLKLELKENKTTGDAKQIEILENAIFEGFEMKVDGKRPKKVCYSSTEQDIFLDAFPCKGTIAKVFDINPPHEVQDVFIGEDVLTPHEHPLRNPVPIKHLKLVPGVKIRFQFLLNDNGGLTSSEKEKLFYYLLLNFGAGARKGTGFGQFIDPDKNLDDSFNEHNWFINFKKLEFTQVNENWPSIEALKKNDVIEGIVLEVKSGNAKVQLYVKGQKEIKNVSGVKDAVNSAIELVIIEFSGSPKKGNYQICKVIKKK